MKTKIHLLAMLLIVCFTAVNIQAQQIVGYSGLFTFNTKYRIDGIISNLNTGLPVQGAIVKTMEFSSLPTNEEGRFQLCVPIGYEYPLTVMAQNFETKEVNSINVTLAIPVAEVNIQLIPLSSNEFSVTTLNPNPNPEISTVQQGGTLHRYYKVTNGAVGNSVAMIPVTVTANMFSENYVSDEDGIVDISINSNRIGQGTPGEQADFAITSVNIVALAEPVPFTGKIVGLNYEKYWDNSNYTKLGGTK